MMENTMTTQDYRDLAAKLRDGAEADIWADTDTLDADDPFIAKIDQTQLAMTDAADRIEALVKERDEHRHNWNQAFNTNAALLERAERLEAALRFYADQNTYETQYEQRSCGCCTDIFEPINEDKGAKARAALTQKDRTDGE